MNLRKKKLIFAALVFIAVFSISMSSSYALDPDPNIPFVWGPDYSFSWNSSNNILYVWDPNNFIAYLFEMYAWEPISYDKEYLYQLMLNCSGGYLGAINNIAIMPNGTFNGTVNNTDPRLNNTNNSNETPNITDPGLDYLWDMINNVSYKWDSVNRVAHIWDYINNVALLYEPTNVIYSWDPNDIMLWVENPFESQVACIIWSPINGKTYLYDINNMTFFWDPRSVLDNVTDPGLNNTTNGNGNSPNPNANPNSANNNGNGKSK